MLLLTEQFLSVSLYLDDVKRKTLYLLANVI